MRSFVLAFLLGILLLQNFAYLPNKNWVWLITLCAATAYFWRLLRLPAACAFGFAWVLWYAHLQLSWSLPENWQGKTLTIKGYIASIPDVTHGTTFLFSANTMQFENEQQHANGLLRLSWHNKNSAPIMLKVGDEWQLTVHLKKIHSLMNPGGFDYEALAMQEGIRAHGYVVSSNNNKLLSSHFYHYSLHRMRQYLKEKIEANLPISNTSPWIVALTLGERHGIAAENWEVLRNTGTNHLMAIAGLHIGFMSGFAYAVIGWLWRRSSLLMLKMPAQHAGAIAALLMALLYSAMAGFSIPTQRACIMLTVFLIMVLLRRKIVAWHAWSTALLFVLLLNPLSVLTDSFWLSFGAVAFIIYGVSGRLSPQGLWWKWGRIQWVIALGLIPFSIGLFQQCSLVSFFANSIAIPWVGFLIVPLSLLGSFLLLMSAKAGSLVLILADKLLGQLWLILTWFAHFSWASWYQVISNHWILIAACIGVVMLLLPAGFPGRYLGVIWLLPLILFKHVKPNNGDVWLTLLDVGQGLSAVIQTQNHFLVFDAGLKIGTNYDMGESVVVPYLRSQGAKQVDMLVVSHGDNDHIGGAPAILRRLRVLSVKTSVPDDIPTKNTSYCLRGQSWEWDQVKFSFIYPTFDNLDLGNDSSCVLRITAGDKHILLTGDIEKLAENNLVSIESINLPADILVAPHHGSKTSAENAFLQTVHPSYVLFPIGYRNRYHFPNPLVVKKYNELGVQQFDTARSGAIQFSISRNQISRPDLYRFNFRHYWN